MTRPSFFVVGAPKCGTSSLTDYLQQHPQIFLPDFKDAPFFGSDLEHRLGPCEGTVADYLQRFTAAPTDAVVGESCVWYLFSRRAAEEIRQFQPDARIIAIFRDPIEALSSLHSHLLFMTDEDIGELPDALVAEEARTHGRRIPKNNRFRQGLYYREVVRYSEQLERYVKEFGSDKVFALTLDDLRARPNETMREIFDFVGVDPRVIVDTSRVVNANKHVRSNRMQNILQNPPAKLEAIFKRVVPDGLHGKLLPAINKLNVGYQDRPRLNPEFEGRLRADLAPGVKDLERLLGRDLPWYTGPS